MNEYIFSDIYVGLEQSFEASVDQSKMHKFLEISNDTNPLHTDAIYAKQKGFDDIVVYGLLTSSFYSTLVGVYLPGKYCILQSTNIIYSSPVYPGDKLIVSGKVSYINNAYKQIEIKATIVNQNHKKVSKATIRTGIIDD